MSVKRVNLTIPEDVLARIDDYCGSLHLPRSSFFQLAATQYLDAVSAAPSVSKLISAMASVLDGTLSGELTPAEAEARVRAIEASYKALSGKDVF